MSLKEKLAEIIGDQEKEGLVLSSLYEFMVSKEQYNKKVAELTNRTDELATLQQEIEKIKVAQMDEKERVKHELAKAEEAKRDYMLKSNHLVAEKILVQGGLTEDDYKDVIGGIVKEDVEQTKQLASGFIDILQKARETTADKVREELLDATPAPARSGDKPTPQPIDNKRFI